MGQMTYMYADICIICQTLPGDSCRQHESILHRLKDMEVSLIYLHHSP